MIPALSILLCYAVLTPPAALIAFPWTLMSGDISLLYRWAMRIASIGVHMAHIRVCVRGLENVPQSPKCIFMANHVSNLDPPVLLPLIPSRTAVLIKRELMKIPVIGIAMRMGGFVPVDRNRKRESARESIRKAAEVLASGVNMTIFPEGTRSRTGQLGPFKKGPFYLAELTGAPIVPISIHGTESMMRKGSLRITPGDAHVEFHPPLLAKDYETREALMAAVRKSVASGLPEWMRG